MAPLTAVQLTVAAVVVTPDDAKPLAVPQAEPAVIVKLLLEISKKILPTASTFILAVVVGVLGIINVSVPSLGVLEANTVGKVCPPSVDKEIFTLAQLTGEAVVLFTLQVMACDELPAHETAVLGDVTANGPEVDETVTTMSLKAVCATETGAVELYAALSLTVKRKFNALETELKASVFTPAVPPVNGPVAVPPASIVDNCGNNLVEEAVGLNEIQFGPVAFVGLAILLAPVCEVEALSFCSQQ